MKYYLRRGEKILGPMTHEQLRTKIEQRVLKPTDEISVFKTGIFSDLKDVHKKAIRGEWEGTAEWLISVKGKKSKPISPGELGVILLGETSGVRIRHIDASQWVALENLSDTYLELSNFLATEFAIQILPSRKSKPKHDAEVSSKPKARRANEKKQDRRSPEETEQLSPFIRSAVHAFVITLILVGLPWLLGELGLAAFHSPAFMRGAKYVAIVLGILVVGVAFIYSPRLSFTLLVTIPSMYVFGKFAIVCMDVFGFMGFDPSQMTWAEIAQYSFVLGLILIASCFSWGLFIVFVISSLIGQQDAFFGMIAVIVLIGFSLMLFGGVLGLTIRLWNAVF